MISIDPSMDQFEIVYVPSIYKSPARAAQIFNQTWLCRYPRPRRVSFDNGSKLKNNFIMLLKDFVVKPKTTSIR